ncbi:hypothetical protein O1L44_19435 [Streptomyces noursei]|nr:hypothetical protein [Streptomyces noursei]
MDVHGQQRDQRQRHRGRPPQPPAAGPARRAGRPQQSGQRGAGEQREADDVVEDVAVHVGGLDVRQEQQQGRGEEQQREAEGTQADRAAGAHRDAGAERAERGEQGEGEELHRVRPHEPADLRRLAGAEDGDGGEQHEDGAGRTRPGPPVAAGS